MTNAKRNNVCIVFTTQRIRITAKQPKVNTDVYLELWMAVQDVYAEIPCDFCQQTNLPMARFLTINTYQAQRLGTPIGIFHDTCAAVLIKAFSEESQ